MLRLTMPICKRNMRKLATLMVLSLAVSLTSMAIASPLYSVSKIYDGDTITLSNGTKVRLLQIDTPELSPEECYGNEARQELIKLIGKSKINLVGDKVSDDKDRYGRLLRYLYIGKINLNLRLVEIGAATPYFYQGEKGQFSTQLLKAAQNAKDKKTGLWKVCPSTKLEPLKAASTGTGSAAKLVTNSSSNSLNCDLNYQGCIPKYPPDLNCADIKSLGLAPVHIIGKDVHKLDGDGDGVGCDK